MQYSYSGGPLEQADMPRRFAVVMYLPPPLEQMVAPLRERFDPDYDIVAAHITLVFPFDTKRSIEELAAIIRAETNQWEPLTVELSSIGDFYPVAPIIYWRVKQTKTLNRLYRQLYARLELPLPFPELVPHVTVGKEISQHRLVLVKDHIASYLRDETFPVSAVDMISPVADHHWVSVRTFPIATE